MSLLKKLKRFDVFREVHNDFTQSSTTGAVVSLICVGVMVFLIVSEFLAFVSVKTTSSMFVQKSSDSKDLNSDIQVNLLIQFPNAPCDILSLDTMDVLGSHTANHKNNLAKTPLNENKGCELKGFVRVSKVPGNFHISTHSHLNRVVEMIDRGEVLDLSHTIAHLSFGEEGLLRVHGEEVSHNPLDSLDQRVVSVFENMIVFNQRKRLKHTGTFEYYLKIVPTIHKKLNGAVRQTYQFSSNSKHFSDEKFPGIFFRYELSPITVEYKESRESLSSFIVKMLGIIGGIFTGFSLVSTWVNLSVARLVRKANQNKLG